MNIISSTKWNFLEDDPNGGTTGEAYHNTLNNAGRALAEELARESLQNSRDATIPGKKLRVIFRFVKLSGADKSTFVSSLDLASLAGRREEIGLGSESCLAHLNGPEPISLLYIEDYNTTGAYGNTRVSTSNLRRLLLTLGDRSKQRNQTSTGGSYGFGKAVYSACSKVRTIVAYTRFDENPDQGIDTRLLGCGYYPPHEFEQHSYVGRAIFGSKNDDGGIDPLTNEAAHEQATALGFQHRQQGDSGTTVLVIEPSVTAVELVKGVETWWWPAILEQLMEVVIIDESGARLIPRPRQRPDLRPFMQAYEIASGIAEPIPPHQRRPDINRLEGIPPGNMGLLLLADDAIENGFPEDLTNRVALMREQLMIVSYFELGGTSPFVIGAFVASPESNTWLRTSEPPTHDRWDHNSPDLEEQDERAPRFIKGLLQRLKRHAGELRRSAAPPAPKSEVRWRIFESTFARLFSNNSPGEPPSPVVEQGNVHIAFQDQPHPEVSPDDPEKIVVRSRFSVCLDREYSRKKAKLKVVINCSILEDESFHGDPLEISVEVQGVPFVMSTDRAVIVELTKDDTAVFTVLSEAYDPSWTVELSPAVIELVD